MTEEVLRAAAQLEEACERCKRFLHGNPDARPRIALREMQPMLEAAVALGRILGVINPMNQMLDVFKRPMPDAPLSAVEVIFYWADAKEFHRNSGFDVITPEGPGIFDPLGSEGRLVSIEDLVQLGIAPIYIVESLSKKASDIRTRAMINMPIPGMWQ